MTDVESSSAPVIIPRADHGLSRKQFSPGTLEVLYGLKDAGFVAYIAGGGVRDLLVGKEPKDFDVATDAHPEQVRRVFRRCRLIGRRFRLAHVYAKGEIIEVSTFRATVSDDAAKARFHMQSDDGVILRDNIYGTPAQDARRRDFSVNALFYDIRDFTVIDYVNGMQDIADRLIRSIGDPDVRFAEDPVRMIRAVRFACSLGFQVEQQTSDAIVRNAERIALASPARMFEEVQKLFFCGNAQAVLTMLDEYKLLGHMLPEVAGAMHSAGLERSWLETVMKQCDRWREHAVLITPELFFALLFGLIHERMIEEDKQAGQTPFHAAESAVRRHLAAIAKSVHIPKAIGLHISQIMSVQPTFLTRRTKKHDRFMRRPCFHDAYIYFKIRSRFSGEHQDEISYWDKRIKEPA